MCSGNKNDPYERVKTFWEYFLNEVEDRNIESMAKYFQLTVEETEHLISNHPDVTPD